MRQYEGCMGRERGGGRRETDIYSHHADPQRCIYIANYILSWNSGTYLYCILSPRRAILCALATYMLEEYVKKASCTIPFVISMRHWYRVLCSVSSDVNVKDDLEIYQ